MPASRHARIGPPSGTEHLYQAFTSQLAEQLSNAETLDRKLGVATAALIALTGAVYAARPPVVIGGVIAGWLFAGLVQAIRGFAYDDRFAGGPNIDFLRERETLDPQVIRWDSLVVLQLSLELNEPRLARKGLRLNEVTLTAGIVAGAVLLSRMLGIVA